MGLVVFLFRAACKADEERGDGVGLRGMLLV